MRAFIAALLVLAMSGVNLAALYAFYNQRTVRFTRGALVASTVVTVILTLGVLYLYGSNGR